MATSTSTINTSGITVGNDGKIKVSGLSSSIDWQSMIDATIEAKRIPAVRLETKISTNTSSISALGQLKTNAASMTESLNLLRGNPAYGSDNVFKTKSATGTTSAAVGAPSGYTPSGIDELLVASISNAAVNGSYQITVSQVAKAQQIRTDVQTSKTDDLALSGSISLNGKTITVKPTDSLLDIRSSINSSGAGVTATIVSASDTSHYLVLTSDTTGTDSEMDFGGGNALTNSLGLTAAGVVKTELQEAKNAELSVNGVTGIVRQTNEIDDLIEGVTISLQKAEEDTVITLNVATDLSSVKTAISDFVTAYNNLKTFITDQRTASDRNNDGTVADDEFGSLYGNSILRQIEDQLSGLVGVQMAGNVDGYQSLSQLGISIDDSNKLVVNETTLDNRLITNVDEVRKLFSLDVSTSDSQVVLADRTSSTASGTYYLNIAGTDASGNILSANLMTTAGSGTGGASNGSVTVSGSTVTAASGAATGLKLIYTGGASTGNLNDVQVTVSRGVADLFYDFFNGLTKSTTGTLDVQVQDLQAQNTDYQSRVDTIDTRLELTRASLTNKYTRMETALAQLESLKKTIQSYTDAANSGS